MTQNLKFDFSDAQNSGFRLGRFEVFNWGTFDSHVWVLACEGHNALLTGDIGSGKSTLVDALTTILVPPQHITYNQAAGASTRERTLASYVRGAYKTEKDAAQFAAKPVFLRKEGNYSVLLAYFFNEGYQTGLTLAQVFWVKEAKSTPERFFILADGALSIAEDFTGFKNMTELKKRLRLKPFVMVFDSFAQYATEFRRKMGIRSDQALELFYKTVSMKSVGNLTEFVREHMLAKSLVEERVENICRHFENLNRAHEAVIKARNQIQMLEPFVADSDRLDLAHKQTQDLRQCRNVLSAYFAFQKTALLDRRSFQMTTELEKIAGQLNQEKEYLIVLRTQEERLRQSILESGGGRLEAIKQEIDQLSVGQKHRARKEEDYARYCQALGLILAQDTDAFHKNRTSAQEIQVQIEADRKIKTEAKVDIQVALQKIKETAMDVSGELHSLRSRQSSIPLQMLQLRQRLCEALGFSIADLPFAGELLEVRVQEASWEGAIERLLHHFGLSLLVPEDHYSAVARYVDATHLTGRLVYFRVREEKQTFNEERQDTRLLIHKLSIKKDSPFHGWVQEELRCHFNYVCVDTLEEFQRETKALTARGQMKTQGRRFEKDDRYALEDRSRYILGWNNKLKVKTLEEEIYRLTQDMARLSRNLGQLENQIKDLENTRDKARDLLTVVMFQEIDWRLLAGQIADLNKERKRLLGKSDVLAGLQASLADVERRKLKIEEAYQAKGQNRAVLEHKLTQMDSDKKEALEELESVVKDDRERFFPVIDTLCLETLKDKALTLENVKKSETHVRERLQAQLDSEDKKIKKLVESVVGGMVAFKNTYPLETQEMDARLEATHEFRAILHRLQREDLPRHEENFRRLLNEGTINDIALFQNQLDKERHEIRQKIDSINLSLRDIEYNIGTYIKLVSDPARDIEVREFQQDLKSCMGGALEETKESLYTERKFLEVKKIIDRFNGRVGLSDIDLKWTRKVTDVRQWFEFSVSERWQQTDEEKEFYSDSSGKSGGQKEKLAYTILASALAYQFGLEWGAVRSRCLRFVMIDEAFGRGSDESARYGLELFKKLNLQLLIVTPLQKIHVIEDYVRSVHFVHNENGACSKLRTITIDLYKEEKKRHQGL